MNSPAPQKASEPIRPYQAIGRPFSFGRLRIQLVAMPRRMQKGGRVKTYQDKTTVVPFNLRGERERFYPFKLGYELKLCGNYLLTINLYKFVLWQLLYERRVRFLDAFGSLLAIKHNNYWENDHLQPLKDMIQRAESIGLRIPLEAFM